MAGNEKPLTEFLCSQIGSLNLDHIGIVTKVSIPTKNGVILARTPKDLAGLSTQDAGKKADIYINDKGVSIKQTGGSFSFNRLQRADLLELFRVLGIAESAEILDSLDEAVDKFHSGALTNRNQPWQDFFSEETFETLLKYLMMEGSPNKGISSHKAEFVLEAPTRGIDQSNTKLSTFEEYFDQNKNKFKIAIRRQWVGQSSKSEHKRSVGLAKKENNKKWVYESISGTPRSGWRGDIEESQKRTVYFLMIEKEG